MTFCKHFREYYLHHDATLNTQHDGACLGAMYHVLQKWSACTRTRCVTLHQFLVSTAQLTHQCQLICRAEKYGLPLDEKKISRTPGLVRDAARKQAALDRANGIITGFDMYDDEEVQRQQQRAARFGTAAPQPEIEVAKPSEEEEARKARAAKYGTDYSEPDPSGALCMLCSSGCMHDGHASTESYCIGMRTCTMLPCVMQHNVEISGYAAHCCRQLPCGCIAGCGTVSKSRAMMLINAACLHISAHRSAWALLQARTRKFCSRSGAKQSLTRRCAQKLCMSTVLTSLAPKMCSTSSQRMAQLMWSGLTTAAAMCYFLTSSP